MKLLEKMLWAFGLLVLVDIIAAVWPYYMHYYIYHANNLVSDRSWQQVRTMGVIPDIIRQILIFGTYWIFFYIYKVFNEAKWIRWCALSYFLVLPLIVYRSIQFPLWIYLVLDNAPIILICISRFWVKAKLIAPLLAICAMIQLWVVISAKLKILFPGTPILDSKILVVLRDIMNIGIDGIQWLVIYKTYKFMEAGEHIKTEVDQLELTLTT